jgi:hypothetical protein
MSTALAVLAIASASLLAAQRDSEALTPTRSDESLAWYDARLFPIENKGWTDSASPYDRLPAHAKGVVRDAVWDLSHNSSGIAFRFVTDAREISVRWTLSSDRYFFDTMPPSGASGLDLYARDRGTWRWAGLARPQRAGTNQERILKGIDRGMREYLMYLPLYNGVRELEIGVDLSAKVFAAPPIPGTQSAPIVFYGTSITQGASASRPGMSYPAILGRELDRPIVNLGFASNGTMDIEIARLMSQIDAVAYVIDCCPNMTSVMIEERAKPFVECLRSARPFTPIVLVEGIEQRNAWLLPRIAGDIRNNNAVLKKAYAALLRAGVEKVYYVLGGGLLGDCDSTTVDGIHPNDKGFVEYARELKPVIRRAIRTGRLRK